MKKISILLLVLWGVIPSMLFAQRQLSFQNGKFKIVQFTDLHWTSMGHRTKRFFQWSGKMGERL